MKRKNRKLINRSGTAECQICNNQEILIEYHINGRDCIDANADYNKCYICDNDHRKIHEGIIIIEGWVMTSNGKELIWHFKDEESFTDKEKLNSDLYTIPKRN